MSITWQEFHGGYNNTGNFNNVVLCGSPSSSGFGGVPLNTAHASGVGQGIGFEGDYSHLALYLNLVGIATNDSGQYMPNQHYVHFGGVYDWFLDVQYSTNGGASYSSLINHQKVFSHDGSQDWELCYAPTWLRTAQNSQWKNTNISIPTNTTHVRVSLTGENPTQSTWVVYPISQVIPTYKPMAIRKSGVMKTLNVPSGFIKIRKSGVLVDKSQEDLSTLVQPNKGHNRIRKSNQALQQGKIGV